MSDNLWPDFPAGKAASSPKAIIEAAGAGLDVKTNGLVRFYSMGMTIRDNVVDSTFSLYAPKLSYHFPFLRARFPIDASYPVTLTADRLPEEVAADESALLTCLANIFRAASTVDTIQKLMSLTL